MKNKTWQCMAAAGLLLAGGVAQAALVPYTANGVDLVYDAEPGSSSTQGLTWTADANLAATNTFGVSGINVDGTMTWAKALEWIAAMNAANYAGANDWRLWSALNSDGSGPCGPAYNCSDSELGHLFYIEGGLSQNQAITSSTALTAGFTNMQDSVYWSGTEYAPNPSSRGSSAPTMAPSPATVRTSSTTVGQFAPDKSPPPRCPARPC